VPRLSMPSDVLTRASTMLRIARHGLRDLADPDPDRVLIGFFCIAVFGRSMTLALQRLRTFDEEAFNDWYGLWEQEMRGDPLCRYFYTLRTDIVHDIDPLIGTVLASYGHNTPPVGAVLIPDRPSPTMHRGRPIADTATDHLCSLYVAYLEEMLTSATSVIWEVQDRWQASQG
jgi:hypothetical protein